MKSCVLFVLSFLFVATAWAGTIQAPLDEMIAQSQSGDKIAVIVVMADKVDNVNLDMSLRARQTTLAQRHYEVVTALREKATKTQSNILLSLDQLKSDGKVEKVRNYWIANMVSFIGTPEAIQQVASLPEVEKIIFDRPVESIQPIISDDEPPVITSHPDGLEVIHATEVWAMGFTGAGRLVSNIDTGVDGTHPALSSRWRGNNGHPAAQCWFDPVQNTTTPTDHGQHGTHTMGTICGRSATTFDTVGVAIDAQWIAAGCVDYGGTTANIIAAFQFIADPDGNPLTTDDVPDCVGNSWGWSPILHGVPQCDNTFWSVIDGCENAGVVVIFSAGNEGTYGPNSLRTPADRATTYFNALSVGAIDGHTPGYPIAYFSSLGPCSCASGDMAIKPECVAPGYNVYSSIPGGSYAGNWSGTSMASPHITGSVAILRQVNPNLDVNTIKNIILQSCVDLGPTGEDNTYGHGYFDLQAAVQMAMVGFGSVDGHIRDANTLVPLPATISVVNGITNITANDLGYYLMALRADTAYTLRASYFGYIPQDNIVTVIANDTVSQDFLLTLAPVATLQGYVTSTNGDTVINATMTILGTPISPVTTDSHGYYRFSTIPSGSRFHIQAQAIGYTTGLDSLDIHAGINNLDFLLQPAESFETTNGLFTGSGVWEWGVPTAGPSGAHSGTKVWGTVLNGNYPDNVDDPLYSRDYALTQDNARLEFYHWYSTESGYDGGNVAISADNGANWTVLTPIGGYPDPDVFGLGNEPGYSGVSAGWVLATYDITGYSGQTIRFRFRFGTDGSTVNYGWYIDDVAVIGSVPPVPPNMAYDPSSFFESAPVGEMVQRSLNISNLSGGPLNFVLSEVMDSTRVDLKVDSQPKTILNQPQMNPTGYIDIKESKPGDEHQPVYPPVIAGYGGPDTYGYRWIDSDEAGGPSYGWIDISSVGTPLTFTVDDQLIGPINLGINFPFYGNIYNSVYVCSNGYLSFSGDAASYSNQAIPTLAVPNDFIASLWDDLSPQRHGSIYYFYDALNSRFIVSFTNIEFFSGGGDVNFEIILDRTGQVLMQYATIDGGTRGLSSLSIGIENADGNDGSQVTYNALYLHSNLAISFTAPKRWLSLDIHDGNLNPGDNISATVTMNAAYLDPGTFNGHIEILSNDPQQGQVAIPVSFTVGGQGAPNIVQSPSSLNDTLFVNGNSTLNLKIRNTGSATLSASFTDSASWISEALGPINIAAGDSVTEVISLNATALTPGTYHSAVVTASNDPDTPSIRVPVTLLVQSIPQPHIVPSVTSFTDTVQTGGSKQKTLYLTNSGSALLYYGLHDDRAWITAVPDTGNVPISLRDTIQVTFNTATLTPGEYAGLITLDSNDPVQSLINLPVNLLVTSIGPNCQYAAGDVNNSGTFTGLDVTYAVRYFKGGPPPPYSCECTAGDTWYVAGDVNGSCTFSGLDITFMVRYFKGGTAPISCPDCPPTTVLSRPQENMLINTDR